MANGSFDPNARYDIGPNAAGCGRFSNQAAATAASVGVKGLNSDGVISGTTLRTGSNAAGIARVTTFINGTNQYNINSGPNATGKPRSIKELTGNLSGT